MYDPIAPINLLQKDNPHQLMGKGHPGKTQCEVRAPEYLLSQTDGTSDHKGNAASSRKPQPVDLLRQFFGGEHLPADLQRNHKHVVADLL